ncbi:hypothetical protein ACJIZ3_011107 [Penstemon smallii]|uniref:Uncharacterized protein n=1 Tax=Penstemon smallii TaxID=265156 RepID=A0ABD3UJQ1_9LAMI
MRCSNKMGLGSIVFKGRISRVDIKGEPVVAQHKHTSIE